MYTPFLRAKRGELAALDALRPDIRRNTVPVFMLGDNTDTVEYSGPCFVLDLQSDINRDGVVVIRSIHAGNATAGYVSIAEGDELDGSTLPKSVSHVFIDVGDLSKIPASALRYMEAALVGMVNTVPSEIAVSIVGVSIPSSMQGVPKGLSRFPRTEWTLFQQVRSASVRPVFYGDYGVRHPESADEYQVYMVPGTKIRYTGDTETVILKGGSTRKGLGFSEFYDLAANLITQSEYDGSTFSWGDEQITQISQQTRGTGNLTTWISIETNHHITKVVNQLASRSWI